MVNKLSDLKVYFDQRNIGNYDRNNYDKFLKEIKANFSFPSVHITGTNGKGSTSNFISNILIKANYKVAFYHSPYFYSPLEMININNNNISEEKFLEYFNKYELYFDKYNLSEFEIETFIALTYFKDENVDIAIIEVGMGGEIDATNVLSNSILQIITSVSLEHTAYLGKSISEIALSKSGIFKENSKVLIGDLPFEAKEVISNQVRLLGSKLYEVSETSFEKVIDNQVSFSYLKFENIRLNTIALYQTKNAKIAIEAALILRERFNISDQNIYDGLKAIELPCRMEKVGKNIILDGAHNVEAMTNLLDSLQKIDHPEIITLFAAFKDKNIDGMLSLLSRDSSKVVITTFDHKRARTEEDYFLYLFDYEFNADYKNALDNLIKENEDKLILVTGSLAFVAEVKRYLKEEKHYV